LSRSLISSFKSTEIEVERYGEGRFVKGRFQKGDLSKMKMLASVQPLSAKEIQLLPEGRRETDSKKVFTSERLFTNDTLAQTSADVLIYKGKKYEVHKVTDWSDHTDLPHFECVAILIDPQGSED